MALVRERGSQVGRNGRDDLRDYNIAVSQCADCISLRNECSAAALEYSNAREARQMTAKNDPAYALRSDDLLKAKRRLRHALNQDFLHWDTVHRARQ
jgi:hypothetical protein